VQLLKRKFFPFKTIVGGIFLTIFLVGFLFFGFNQFLIREIEVKFDSPRFNLSGLYFLKGKNLLFLDEKKTATILLKNNPRLVSVKLEKKLPNRLIIIIKSENPSCLIRANKGFFLVNNKGKIIEKLTNLTNSNKDLPIINFYQVLYFDRFFLGQVIDYQEILMGLKIVEKVMEFGYEVNTIDILGKDMILLKTEGEEKNIYFNLEKKIETQLYQLEFLLKQLKIRGLPFKAIDLRFEKPVIKN